MHIFTIQLLVGPLQETKHESDSLCLILFSDKHVCHLVSLRKDMQVLVGPFRCGERYMCESELIRTRTHTYAQHAHFDKDSDKPR